MMCEKRQASVGGRTFGIYFKKMGYQRHIEIFAKVTSERIFYSIHIHFYLGISTLLYINGSKPNLAI